jgi:hypothetical protein
MTLIWVTFRKRVHWFSPLHSPIHEMPRMMWNTRIHLCIFSICFLCNCGTSLALMSHLLQQINLDGFSYYIKNQLIFSSTSLNIRRVKERTLSKSVSSQGGMYFTLYFSFASGAVFRELIKFDFNLTQFRCNIEPMQDKTNFRLTFDVNLHHEILNSSKWV